MWLKCRPHADLEEYRVAWEKKMNAIFLPMSNLTFAPKLPGSGTFCFKKKLILTKEGYSRSRWEFPETMRGVTISHNPKGWKQDYFQSAAIGQEFVMEGTPAVMNWVENLFDLKKN